MIPSHWIFEREFELRFIKSRGAAFQDLFSDLMEHAYPGDFVRTRSHGNIGDLKCDGYLTSQKIVFQLYGPEEMRSLSRLVNKIKDDYFGAKRNWTGRMDRWIFVHNSQSGIPAQAIQLLDDFRSDPDAPNIEIWGFENLRVILHHLTDDSLQNLLPCINEKNTSIENLNQLPDIGSVEHYWSWLESKLDEPMYGPRICTLKSITVPIRLVLPDKARKYRLAEEKEIHEYRTDPTIAREGTFEKGLDFGRINITWSLRKKRHILILGDSGSGKSTLLRLYAKKLVKKLVNSGFARKRGHTPILVELWRFSPTRSLISLIYGSVKRSGANISEGELSLVMDRGYVVLLLDGLDEVNFEHRRDCLAQINELVEAFPRIRLILTSRPFPKPPENFYYLEILPLTDAIIATSLRKKFGTVAKFRKLFGGNSPDDYVRLVLRPEIRQLFRTPLTLGMMIALLENNGSLPDNLFDIFNRFVSWLVDWDVQRGNLRSVVSAISVLEKIAYLIVNKNANSIPTSDWLKISGNILDELQLTSVSSNSNAEDLLKVLLSTGLLQELGGEVTFSHRSMLEFCAARHIIEVPISVHTDPVALQLGVARFISSKLADVTLLLEEHFLRCVDVHDLLPLLKEANIAGRAMGRFEPLLDAVIESQELSINLTYYTYHEGETPFSKIIDNIINTCLCFKPKALSVLKETAANLVTAEHWDDTSIWFEKIVSALESYNWPGGVLHRRFIKIRFFEFVKAFCDDGSDPEAPYRLEELYAYLDAMHEDDFIKAHYYLDKLAQTLFEYITLIEGNDANTNIYHMSSEVLSNQLRLWSDDDFLQSRNDIQ